MFSIVLPLYNKASYIHQAILSIQNQTYQDFELIVVDDGSTDNSLEKLRIAIDDLRFTNVDLRMSIFDLDSPNVDLQVGHKFRIFKQENQGVSATRNKGVKLAKYDYIAFLDADDWWEPSYLFEMKLLIEEFPHAGIYGCSYYKVKNKSNIAAQIGVETNFTKGYINYSQVYVKTFYMPFWTGATVVKKGYYQEENGFKPNLKFGEDFDLWVRIATKHKAVLLNKHLSYYNQDVDVSSRAAGGQYYKPNEHFIFQDYTELMDDKEFVFLFEVLALYVLLPLYIADKYTVEVKSIIKSIHWENHSFKYRLYYKILPKFAVMWWLFLFKFGSRVKRIFK